MKLPNAWEVRKHTKNSYFWLVHSIARASFVTSVFCRMNEGTESGLHQQPGLPTDDNESIQVVGAKRRLTKQEKKELRNQRMIEVRHRKYEKQRARKKQKTIESLDASAPHQSSELSYEADQTAIVYGPRKKDILAQRLTENLQCGVNICVDLGYDEKIHNFRERSSLVKQLILCYSHLKLSPASVHFHLSSIKPNSLLIDKMHGMGFENWFASRHEKAPEEIWDSPNIVILSPDATEVLEDIDINKVYVIGGIVDRTVRKSATLNTAERIGATTKRLPLKEHIGNLVTHVLNVDHVFRILCDYIETKSWKEAIERQVPQRRIAEVDQSQVKHCSNPIEDL